jgi:hypothetical protein
VQAERFFIIFNGFFEVFDRDSEVIDICYHERNCVLIV